MIPKKPALGLDPRVDTGFRIRSRSNIDSRPWSDSIELDHGLGGGNQNLPPAHECAAYIVSGAMNSLDVARPPLAAPRLLRGRAGLGRIGPSRFYGRSRLLR